MLASNISTWLTNTYALTRPRDIKVSGADWATEPIQARDREAPVVLTLERANSQVKLFLVDFTEATNLLDGGALETTMNSLGLENWVGYQANVDGLAALGIKPGVKMQVFDTMYTLNDKFEKIKGDGDKEGVWNQYDSSTGVVYSEKQEGVVIADKHKGLGCELAMGSDNDFGE